MLTHQSGSAWLATGEGLLAHVTGLLGSRMWQERLTHVVGKGLLGSWVWGVIGPHMWRVCSAHTCHRVC